LVRPPVFRPDAIETSIPFWILVLILDIHTVNRHNRR
jgi:hypothetical protein